MFFFLTLLAFQLRPVYLSEFWTSLFFTTLKFLRFFLRFHFCCRTTVSGLEKVAIFTTKFHTKHQSSNLAKTVIRSTEPPLLPNPCYKLPFFLSKSCSVEFAVSLCGWAGMLFCKHWLVCRLVGLANVYDCKGVSLCFKNETHCPLSYCLHRNTFTLYYG